MSGLALRLDGIGHVYRSDAASVRALAAVTLDLRAGEVFSVVGPSGCGKSTLLDILAGLTAASEGSLDWSGGTPKPGDIGVVFQQDASFPWLDVQANIAFPLKRRGLAAQEIATRVDEAMQMVGLSQFARHYPAELSGGMRQRVCIARTLVTRPRMLLLDEPFAALDSQTRLLMGEEVLEIWRRTGATVVLITHSLDEAAMLSDRVGVMSARPGRFLDVIETGWPRERDSRIAETDAFGHLVARIWGQLRSESMAAMGRAGDAA